MNTVYEFVRNEMTEDERLQCITDHSQLEEDGYIGDSVLRSKTNELMKLLNAEHSVMIFMDYLMKEVFRFYTTKYFKIVHEL